jgi:hypothetical protein
MKCQKALQKAGRVKLGTGEFYLIFMQLEVLGEVGSPTSGLHAPI